MPDTGPKLPPGRRILEFETLDSTNAEALRRAAAGEPGGLWITARRQTEGRGRAGRSWQSEPGNLHASLMIRLALPAPHACQLSLVAGVAVIDAIRATMGPAPEPALRLKWPNDILMGAAKAGGILVESSAHQGGLAAAIGIGINLVRHPEHLGRAATHLGAHGRAPEPAVLVAALAVTIEDWLESWAEGQGFGSVRDAWLARSGPIGEQISINTGREVVQGAYLGLDAQGALLLRDTGGCERRFSFGDVALAG
jgi:BirA family biotin operon repressor/biotin-[acetyl-CoA-carboxylase] ligase